MALDAFIADGIRSPIGKLGGQLSGVRADDLAAHVLRALLERNPSLPADQIDDVILGCANQAGEDNRNVARMALLLAGLPVSVPGLTVNRLCASGMSAVVEAARAIQLGDAELIIAGGVEQMTRAPFVMGKSPVPFARQVEVYDTSLGWRFVNPDMEARYGVEAMGCTAENLVEGYGISRDEQDHFAVRSQHKAEQARGSGRLAKEIAPLQIPQHRQEPLEVHEDESIRPGTTFEQLARLKPVFRTDGGGSVTAGNSSSLNDGSAALVIASESALRNYHLAPKARIVASAVVGVEPRIMGIGPVNATRKCLARANLSLEQISIIELNEAFAAQALACLKLLDIPPDDPRLNPNGGAIALGHPLGMSGARLILTAVRELEISRAQYALCTMCVGVGQGMAVILERME